MSIHDLTASLDLKQNLNIYATCKQFDSLNLILSIYNNSVQADLTNYNIRLRAMKADKVPLIQEHVGITVLNNVVTIESDEQLTTTSGRTPIELQFINKTTGKKKATFNLVLIVVPSTLEVNATVSTATYTLLQELENKLDQASDFFENIDEAIEANSTLEVTIDNSEIAKISLEDSTSAATTTTTELDILNTEANITKTALNTSKINADASKVAIDISKTNADTSKEALEVVVQEANDFAAAHQDIENLVEQVNLNSTQLSDIVQLSSSEFGILGDGTDETSKIISMMNAIPANGAKIIFDKSKQVIINGTSLISINNKTNVVIEGLNLSGSSNNVFRIENGSKNIIFRDCVFRDLGYVILLYNCGEIVIDNCVFDHTGYGIIQQTGYVSNNVKVINCIAKNMQKDFIECNCTSVAKSKNWIISNNHYLGGINYPALETETRFVGITAVENVIISNNIVEKVCGDSAIHLEDIGGNIIINNNIIDNVVGGSYIFIYSNEKTVLIDNNIFLRTDTTIGVGIVYNLTNSLTNNIKFSNNKVKGINKNLNGFDASFHTNLSCTGNIFEDCNKAIIINTTINMAIKTNEFINCNYGVHGIPGASGGLNTDIQIIGNTFSNTVTSCVEIRRNTSGSGASARCFIANNVFDKNAIGFDTVDFTCVGNIIASGMTLEFGQTYYVGSTGYVVSNNRIIGTQAIINSGDRIFYGTGIPSTGSYLKNDKVINTNPAIGKYLGWVCAVAGTPGTWAGYGQIGATLGATSSRPASGISNGYQYLDTTLSPSGKPIWWNGTTWVDSTGTTV